MKTSTLTNTDTVTIAGTPTLTTDTTNTYGSITTDGNTYIYDNTATLGYSNNNLVWSINDDVEKLKKMVDYIELIKTALNLNLPNFENFSEMSDNDKVALLRDIQIDNVLK